MTTAMAEKTAVAEPETVLALRKLFGELGKREALEMAISDLLLCWGRKNSSEHGKLHVRVLLDMDVELLIRGLSEAALSTKPLLPGDIWELCMGGSRADLAAQEAEEAWAWMLRYIQNHGKDGHVKRGALIGYGTADGSTTEYDTGRPLFAPDTPAPEIPEAIGRVLAVLGGTIKGGVERIALTPTTELAWVKKEFVAGYVRAGRLG